MFLAFTPRRQLELPLCAWSSDEILILRVITVCSHLVSPVPPWLGASFDIGLGETIRHTS